MFQAIRYAGPIVAALCSVNLFFHVREIFRNLRAAKTVVPLCAAIVQWFLMRDPFSTAWMICLHLSVVLAAFDAISLILRAFGPNSRAHAGFRALIRRGLAFFAAALVCVYGVWNMKTVRRTDYALQTDKFSGEIKIALISDTHLGNALNADGVLKIADRAIADGADALILAGDLVDEGSNAADFAVLCEGLSRRPMRLGAYYVFGNHDGARYGGSVSSETVESGLSEAGVTVLTDESLLLNGWLRVVGRREASVRSRLSPESLLKNADPETEYILFIDHQPAETKACAAAGVDLLLSGHTHNGQIWPIGVISEQFGINEIEYGCKDVDGMKAIVSSGASGWGCAFRTSGKSEYVMITLNGISETDSPESMFSAQ